jgi:hypothetical protein
VVTSGRALWLRVKVRQMSGRVRLLREIYYLLLTNATFQNVPQRWLNEQADHVFGPLLPHNRLYVVFIVNY